jgi:transposase
MRPPLFVRALTDEERTQLTAGLRSSEAVVLRRCQIVLASARGERVAHITHTVGCSEKTVRQVLRRFNAQGVVTLAAGSTRPHRVRPQAFAGERAEQLRALLHRSPREFGKPGSLWTLEWAAEVSFAQGLSPTRVSDETIRQTLKRLGVGWKRAKQWITSPDPEYVRKKLRRQSRLEELLFYGRQGGSRIAPKTRLSAPGAVACVDALTQRLPGGKVAWP